MFETAQGSFSGHETFAFRYGWPKKGVDAVTADPSVFGKDSAMVLLGVGKNMVRSIRHWCLTARLIEGDSDIPNNRGRCLRATQLGLGIFGPDGSDPYLEDPGTVWLLHWLIASNDQRATTWRWAFGSWAQQDFSREQLIADLTALIDQKKIARVTASSLHRDVDTFLHTYVPGRISRTLGIEDSLDCPLVELGLIKENPVSHGYTFVRGAKPTLPDDVLAFAILEYWDRIAPGQQTLSFEDVLYREGSPGRVFKLDESALFARLERASKWSRGSMLFDETAGLRQLMRQKQMSPLDTLRLSGRGSRRAA